MSEQPTTTETEPTDEQHIELTDDEQTNNEPDDATPDEQHDDADERDEQRNPNAEAAKYRRKLRETEAERDTLKATLEGLQRAEVERQVEGRLSQPGDVFSIGGLKVEDVLDEQGRVVPELVDTALHGLLSDRPGLAKPAPKQKFPSGIGLGNRGPGPGGTSWEEAFEQALRH